MLARDPNKTARNKKVKALKEELRQILPYVISEISSIYPNYNRESSINAFIGSKTGEYLNVYTDVIKTPMEYLNCWYKGFKKEYINALRPRHERLNTLLSGEYPHFKRYFIRFLEKSFLKHYDELVKNKPDIENAEYWFGNNNDEYGLLVSPRFNRSIENWENDRSEIRKFKHPYWTISHVINTGLCYLGEDYKREFESITEYLSFFNDLIRRTNSEYQRIVASRYIEFVKKSDNPNTIPLLIPELRYAPFVSKHIHRLDFLIINPWDLSKTGFEFSPWSSHGQLKGKEKKLKELNEDAKTDFEKEMTKHKRFWRKYNINYVTYTDEDLTDMDFIWNEMKRYLTIDSPDDYLSAELLELLEEVSDAKPKH